MRALARAIETAPGPIAVTSRMAGLDLGVAERRIVRVRWPVRRRHRVASSGSMRSVKTRRRSQPKTSISSRSVIASVPAASAAVRRRRVRCAKRAIRCLPLTMHDLQEGIRNNIAERLGELATRVDVTQTWDDLVLPPDTLDDVRALIARVRHAAPRLREVGLRAEDAARHRRRRRCSRDRRAPARRWSPA